MGDEVEHQHYRSHRAGEHTQAALNDVADRLTIARQRSGQCEKTPRDRPAKPGDDSGEGHRVR
jgi:hypothetical protein